MYGDITPYQQLYHNIQLANLETAIWNRSINVEPNQTGKMRFPYFPNNREFGMHPWKRSEHMKMCKIDSIDKSFVNTERLITPKGGLICIESLKSISIHF